MKTTVKNAIKLAQKIEQLYNNLNINNPAFFNQYHDNMGVQVDCVWDEVAEVEAYLKFPTKKYGYQKKKPTGAECADMCMQNLTDTLKYCEAVIKLQEQTLKLPKSIYG